MPSLTVSPINALRLILRVFTISETLRTGINVALGIQHSFEDALNFEHLDTRIQRASSKMGASSNAFDTEDWAYLRRFGPIFEGSGPSSKQRSSVHVHLIRTIPTDEPRWPAFASILAKLTSSARTEFRRDRQSSGKKPLTSAFARTRARSFLRNEPTRAGRTQRLEPVYRSTWRNNRDDRQPGNTMPMAGSRTGTLGAS